MDLLGLQSHLQDSARRAAGSFLSPLTNAIGEQRRLIDSLAVVSKVRVDECKHMMEWSKTQVNALFPSSKVTLLDLQVGWVHSTLIPLPSCLTRKEKQMVLARRTTWAMSS